MLTVAEQTLQEIAEKRGERISTHLYGQEINSETYAICKADLLLKGEENADANIIGGPEYSTLSNDAFKGQTFDFMLSNPPYGKSWKTDQDRMGGRNGITDPRFVIQHGGDPEYSLITRSSDGQLLFLANMLSKMKEPISPLGSRIAEVHNGSSIIHGGRRSRREQHPPVDHRERLAGGHRRPTPQHVLQHWHRHLRLGPDQPEARAPEGLRPTHRRDPVVHAPQAEPGPEELRAFYSVDVQKICDAFIDFEDAEQSKIFPNEAFGYWKVTVERPLRIEGIEREKAHSAKEIRETEGRPEPAQIQRLP